MAQPATDRSLTME